MLAAVLQACCGRSSVQQGLHRLPAYQALVSFKLYMS